MTEKGGNKPGRVASSRIKTLENYMFVWNTEKINATGYECWKIMSSLKTKPNKDFTMYKDVTSGLEKNVNHWRLGSINIYFTLCT